MNCRHNDNIPTMAFLRVVKFNSPSSNYFESFRRLDEETRRKKNKRARKAAPK